MRFLSYAVGGEKHCSAVFFQIEMVAGHLRLKIEQIWTTNISATNFPKPFPAPEVYQDLGRIIEQLRGFPYLDFRKRRTGAFGEVQGRVQVCLNSVVAAAGLPIICRVVFLTRSSRRRRGRSEGNFRFGVYEPLSAATFIFRCVDVIVVSRGISLSPYRSASAE